LEENRDLSKLKGYIVFLKKMEDKAGALHFHEEENRSLQELIQGCGYMLWLLFFSITAAVCKPPKL
jgi:hypothetical protein